MAERDIWAILPSGDIGERLTLSDDRRGLLEVRDADGVVRGRALRQHGGWAVASPHSRQSLTQVADKDKAIRMLQRIAGRYAPKKRRIGRAGGEAEVTSYVPPSSAPAWAVLRPA